MRRLDGRPFGSYRTLVGTYPLDPFEIVVDHAPVDPAAGPARLRLRVRASVAGLPEAWLVDGAARLAIEDLVARAGAAAVAASGLRREGAPPGSGSVAVEPPGEAVVERGACRIADGAIELRVLVDLPAQARTIRGLAAERLLTEELPRLATATLLFGPTRRAEAEAHVASVRRHRAIQLALAGAGLVAFFAEGALPALPAALAVTIDAGGERIRGAGVPAGVTLIAGGALQGKSALLDAIAAGVHPYPPGHARAGIVTVSSAAVLRSERGRPLERADLSLFVRPGAGGLDPAAVTTHAAPPALAQAASAVEAIAAGAGLLLVDEDDAAPAFLARDARMQRLVPVSDAGFIPLVDRARDLYEQLSVSTIVASGSTGDFLADAHTTLVVRDGVVEDATSRAKEIAAATRAARAEEPRPNAVRPEAKVAPVPAPEAGFPTRIALHGRDGVRVGDKVVDLGPVATLVEPGQRRALGAILARSWTEGPGPAPLADVLDAIERAIDERGLDALAPHGAHDLSRPRRVEIAAALARAPR